MFKYLLILLSLWLHIKYTHNAPATRMETDPELTAAYYEGDMMLSTAQRNGLIANTYRWPERIVYYRFSSNIDQQHRAHILLGMKQIELSSCLTFKAASKQQPYYVNVTAESGGCYSAVGFRNRVQQVNLETYPIDTGCYRLGSIMHELLHALGFYHQQSAADRDDYVRVAYENVIDGKERNFQKYDDNTVDNFDQPYDYGSVMHYTPYGFSKNGEMTLVPLDAKAAAIMGQRLQMSQADINKLNVMYKCPKLV
ncbi:seminal metalloprotease 1-like [Drosophila busckii]|uniref:seminal metalloprotease 1-like n=1 Tax=Drosophila busckii TaxID=30019 RepID=UPI00083ED7FD|nr:seminal metalloprotease 1-like [Drosophila busckii]